jgi:hypothetical protein
VILLTWLYVAECFRRIGDHLLVGKNSTVSAIDVILSSWQMVPDLDHYCRSFHQSISFSFLQSSNTLVPFLGSYRKYLLCTFLVWHVIFLFYPAFDIHYLRSFERFISKLKLCKIVRNCISYKLLELYILQVLS